MNGTKACLHSSFENFMELLQLEKFLSSEGCSNLVLSLNALHKSDEHLNVFSATIYTYTKMHRYQLCFTPSLMVNYNLYQWKVVSSYKNSTFVVKVNEKDGILFSRSAVKTLIITGRHKTFLNIFFFWLGVYCTYYGNIDVVKLVSLIQFYGFISSDYTFNNCPSNGWNNHSMHQHFF